MKNEKMKKKIVLLMLAAVIAHGGFVSARKIRRPVIPVNLERLYTDVKKLTAILPPRNFRNVSSLDRAADYIAGEFKKCSRKVGFQVFKVKESTYKNVIASFGTESAERIVIGAHYDVCGNAPGADDNGSGVAVLLELGRMIGELKPKLNDRIDLVAFTLEEPPFFRTPFMGSTIHARSLAKAGVKVKLMMSVDMIGFFPGEPPGPGLSKAYTDGKDNATAVVGRPREERMIKKIRRCMAAGAAIEVIAIIAPPSRRGIDFSDHLNYWNQDFPAVFITNYFTTHNPNYHSPGDTVDTLDFPKIAEVVRALYRVIVNV